MADITRLAQVTGGNVEGIDLQTNTPVVLSVKVGGVTNSELTKAILDNLIALQNGTDFSTGTNSHTHDGRYYTKAILNSATSSSGSDLIGDDNTYSNFTPAAATVKGALSGIDSALGSFSITPDFSSALFRVHDSVDSSKKVALDVSAIATSTVRTITVPNSNVDLGQIVTAIQRAGTVTFTANQPMGGFKLTGLGAGTTAGDSVRYEQAILASGVNAFTADQSLGTHKLTNVGDPTASQDAATKAYVDAVALGLSPKKAVYVASTANLTLSGEQTIDGFLTSASRVLVKDQTSAQNNGIYVTAAGAWSRSTDMDSLTPIDEVNGAWVPVQFGTVNAGRIYVQYGTVATIGTDPINFEFYNPLAALVGGDMITVSGSTISVDLATVSGLESSNPGNAAGQLRVKLEASNPSLQISGSNELGAKLDTAGAIVKNASGLATNPDGSSIELNSNALRVKTTAYDQSTITGGSGSAAAVQRSPLVRKSYVAGEAFGAGISFLVRWALTGETAGRIYKADNDATTTNNYYAFGIALSAAGVSAGGNIDVTLLGSHDQGANDTAFSSGNVGKPVFLSTSGAYTLVAPSAANSFVVRIGVVQTTTSIFVQPQTIAKN